MDRSRLSIVVPIYNEANTIAELERRLGDVVATLAFDSAEVLLVSDGSTDETEELIRELAGRDPLFKGVFLTRNFGHQAAISTGLRVADGDVVAILDGDLQDPPEVLPEMIATLEAGADVAYGIRASRQEAVLKRAAYNIFYRTLSKVASIDIPPHSGDFCCMRRPVVDAMLQLPESGRFVRGIRAWVGFRQVGVPFERAARFAGEPKYSVAKLIGLAYDGFFSFSRLPIQMIQLLGFLASSGALFVAFYYLVWSFIEPERFPAGFATLTISIWFLAGVQLLFLGIVGEYVARALDEARRRPVAFIREIVSAENATKRSDP